MCTWCRHVFDVLGTFRVQIGQVPDFICGGMLCRFFHTNADHLNPSIQVTLSFVDCLNSLKEQLDSRKLSMFLFQHPDEHRHACFSINACCFLALGEGYLQHFLTVQIENASRCGCRAVFCHLIVFLSFSFIILPFSLCTAYAVNDGQEFGKILNSFTQSLFCYQQCALPRYAARSKMLLALICCFTSPLMHCIIYCVLYYYFFVSGIYTCICR